jgi:hypothetical protein
MDLRPTLRVACGLRPFVRTASVVRSNAAKRAEIGLAPNPFGVPPAELSVLIRRMRAGLKVPSGSTIYQTETAGPIGTPKLTSALWNAHRCRLAEEETTLKTQSNEAAHARAEASFRKEERAKEGAKAMMEYQANGRMIREKTERLKALRLAKEAADKERAG